jgi:glutamate-ammonia-ligase adenylyltransferase
MRDRVRQGHPVSPDRFDVKHSPGGMVDAEFAVQYLVLLHTAAHPELADNVGNIALLMRLEAVGLLPVGMGDAAANAYREMRRAQHRARLNEEPTDVDLDAMAQSCDAVRALWAEVMHK